MSQMGLVSRVSPVHTALRNCTRDEGRSFEVGHQVLISNHRKLLLSKAMVVNVAEKSEQGSHSRSPSLTAHFQLGTRSGDTCPGQLTGIRQRHRPFSLCYCASI